MLVVPLSGALNPDFTCIIIGKREDYKNPTDFGKSKFRKAFNPFLGTFQEGPEKTWLRMGLPDRLEDPWEVGTPFPVRQRAAEQF